MSIRFSHRNYRALVMGLGKVLKEKRQITGWHQAEAARQIGISKSYLANIEAERKEPRLEVLEQMASKYGTKLYIIFKQLDK